MKSNTKRCRTCGDCYNCEPLEYSPTHGGHVCTGHGERDEVGIYEIRYWFVDENDEADECEYFDPRLPDPSDDPDYYEPAWPKRSAQYRREH